MIQSGMVKVVGLELDMEPFNLEHFTTVLVLLGGHRDLPMPRESLGQS
jgi:hypothetical protein